MNSMRAVIVDDEPMARLGLCRMLAGFQEIEICGEAETVEQADQLIRETEAEVVFLDIELFSESGFDLVPRLDKDVAVIFVTAFNQYAIRAFEVNALDYLLKPVNAKRLGESIHRLLDRAAQAPPLPDPKQLRLDDLIMVRNSTIQRMLPLGQVCVIRAKGDYTILCFVDGYKGTVWRRLNNWEQILPEQPFARIHRSMIVNLDHIQSCATVSGNRLQLQLTGLAQPCFVSRRLTPHIRMMLRDRFSLQPST